MLVASMASIPTEEVIGNVVDDHVFFQRRWHVFAGQQRCVYRLPWPQVCRF